jgi:hypothetical protein
MAVLVGFVVGFCPAKILYLLSIIFLYFYVFFILDFSNSTVKINCCKTNDEEEDRDKNYDMF